MHERSWTIEFIGLSDISHVRSMVLLEIDTEGVSGIEIKGYTPRAIDHRSGWWKKLVDQSIVRSFEWVDEFYTLQHKAILKIFSKQVLHTGTLRRSP